MPKIRKLLQFLHFHCAFSRFFTSHIQSLAAVAVRKNGGAEAHSEIGKVGSNFGNFSHGNVGIMEFFPSDIGKVGEK